jgi:hypothetical protein
MIALHAIDGLNGIGNATKQRKIAAVMKMITGGISGGYRLARMDCRTESDIAGSAGQ